MAPTLVRPPPEDPSKAPIENVVEVTELAALGPDIFTNTRQPWQPTGARGIFGGAVIAMSLAAGQRTVPDAFAVHSCHCYFLLAGQGDLPILLHVERVRDGRSFATRTVQARQRGRCIFTVTMSFMREGSGGRPDNQVRHAAPMPGASSASLMADGGEKKKEEEEEEKRPQPPEDRSQGGDRTGFSDDGPFESFRIEIVNKEGSAEPRDRKTRHWVRAKGRISAEGGHQAQLNALAYVSDSFFIGTLSRIHRLWRFPFKPEEFDDLPRDLQDRVRQLVDFEGGEDIDEMRGRPAIGMMVSLDHTIYFHEPKRLRADEWMLTEMESPWSGDGRGVVTQRIFSKDGTLLATCVQEGLVRLREPEGGEGDAAKARL